MQADEGDDLTFTVSVANPPSSGDVTVNYEVRGITATGPGSATGDDFDMKSPTTATGTLTITAPQTTATVTLTTEKGDAYEPDETLRLDLTSPSANAVFRDAVAIGTIVQECVNPTDSNQDPPTLSHTNRAITGLPGILRIADEGQQVYFAITVKRPLLLRRRRLCHVDRRGHHHRFGRFHQAVHLGGLRVRRQLRGGVFAESRVPVRRQHPPPDHLLPRHR